MLSAVSATANFSADTFTEPSNGCVCLIRDADSADRAAALPRRPAWNPTGCFTNRDFDRSNRVSTIVTSYLTIRTIAVPAA